MNKKKVLSLMCSAIQFFPLLAFVWGEHLKLGWDYLFIFSGCLAAVLVTLSLFKVIQKSDKFVLAFNCFLIGGAAMFLFNIKFLGYVYKNFIEATLFIWLFIIGVITTLFAPEGFIDLQSSDKAKVRMLSLYLLAGVVGAFVFSIFFKGNTFIAGAIPYIGLTILRKILAEKVKLG